ncbi:MAG: preprotein translocase subunit SecE [Puniceicoccales bacterium]|jgi:preprotein translocase SecE subunit|nr:preprotein translocase subunit SecE [Puniceicoccales bacterium]
MNPFRRVSLFCGETIEELKKASWPNAKELRRSTIAVLVGMLVWGIYVSILDFALGGFVNTVSSWVRGCIG